MRPNGADIHSVVELYLVLGLWLQVETASGYSVHVWLCNEPNFERHSRPKHISNEPKHVILLDRRTLSLSLIIRPSFKTSTQAHLVAVSTTGYIRYGVFICWSSTSLRWDVIIVKLEEPNSLVTHVLYHRSHLNSQSQLKLHSFYHVTNDVSTQFFSLVFI